MLYNIIYSVYEIRKIISRASVDNHDCVCRNGTGQIIIIYSYLTINNWRRLCTVKCFSFAGCSSVMIMHASSSTLTQLHT